MNIDSSLAELNGVGEKIAKRLQVLGLLTARDLLFHFPFRYDDFTKTIKIKDLQAGDKANVIGQIELLQNKRAWKRKIYITEALISDGTETLKVIWFNQPFIAKTLKVGDTVSLAGKVEEEYNVLTMTAPIYEKIGQGAPIHTAGLVPNYHLTESITQKQLRFLINQSLPLIKDLADPLPQEIKNRLGLLDQGEAIKKIHFPRDWQDVESARRRLAFDELFRLQLRSRLIKKERDKTRAPIIEFKEKETKELVASLPFKLTDDQRQAAWQILQDLGQARPMARLLDGDVGSGKTLVAILALFNAALNGKQAVLMAPTEILARQHFNTITKILAAFPLKIALLTSAYRSLNTSEESPARAEILKSIKKGEVDIIIGTHALIQDEVKFKNLALAVVDEQHRFGVNQRKNLVEKTGCAGLAPHLLSMTATPIPRSLALALFGDLDISMIKQMPAGRKPILTKVVPENKRAKAYAFIKEQIAAGRQAFVICPLIEESDFFGAKAVKQEFEKLDKEVFPEIKMAMLHGRMKPKEKEETMRLFLEKEHKILISTSVVEVGVDVPNATIMLIEGAERFGLAQLHQFRGRVGRGSDQSYCFLFTPSDDLKAKKRLEALETLSDGFALAKTDLKMRGSGEIYGTAQTGFPELHIASLFDYELMKQAEEETAALFAGDPELINHPELAQELEKLEKNAHLE